jgi:hypothetical protein
MDLDQPRKWTPNTPRPELLAALAKLRAQTGESAENELAEFLDFMISCGYWEFVLTEAEARFVKPWLWETAWSRNQWQRGSESAEKGGAN